MIMPIKMRIFSFLVGLFLFILIIELVRRRKMREEYSFLWLLSGVLICIASVSYEVIAWITKLVGAVYGPSMLFFFGLLFLAVISIFYSVKLSQLSDQVKNLAQMISILESEKKHNREQ
jgi:hypothetical protein